MNRANTITQIMNEAVVSGKEYTEEIFDEYTVARILEVLISGTKKFALNPKNRINWITKNVKQFADYISNNLGKIPNFLHSQINFLVTRDDEGTHLFIRGTYNDYTNIITIYVNPNYNIKLWKEHWKDKFKIEIGELRALVRHELTHRLEYEKISSDRIKRSTGRKSRKLTKPYKNSDEYYGQPTEITAYANHIVELIAQQNHVGWQWLLKQFVLSDNSKNFKNTRRLIRKIMKLMKEYNVSWSIRRQFKRDAIQFAREIRAKNKNNNEVLQVVEDEINTATSNSNFSSQYR